MSDLGLLLTDTSRRNSLLSELSTEFIRKSIHLLIALVPVLAAWNRGFTVLLLASGTLMYTYCEHSRRKGAVIPFVSMITTLAARKRDAGHFVLGPVTLGLGALMALVLYPEPAATIAIYALAFGDGLSSLVGRIFGSIRLPFTGGKSLEGSLTCFFAVLTIAYSVTGSLPRSAILALVATVVEALPTKDMDNILLPLATGLSAVWLFAWL